jgi:hypothetical protein
MNISLITSYSLFHKLFLDNQMLTRIDYFLSKSDKIVVYNLDLNQNYTLEMFLLFYLHTPIKPHSVKTRFFTFQFFKS